MPKATADSARFKPMTEEQIKKYKKQYRKDAARARKDLLAQRARREQEKKGKSSGQHAA